jgi:hypothetical protein
MVISSAFVVVVRGPPRTRKLSISPGTTDKQTASLSRVSRLQEMISFLAGAFGR